jgi:hypothetical protein
MRYRWQSMAALVPVLGLALASAHAAWAADKAAAVDLPALRHVAGVLKSVESKPNVPGARCGYHYELVVASSDGPVRVMIYDHTAPLEKLDGFVDREVEVAINGQNIARSVQLRGVAPEPNDKLANLTNGRHC